MAQLKATVINPLTPGTAGGRLVLHSAQQAQVTDADRRSLKGWTLSSEGTGTSGLQHWFSISENSTGGDGLDFQDLFWVMRDKAGFYGPDYELWIENTSQTRTRLILGTTNPSAYTSNSISFTKTSLPSLEITTDNRLAIFENLKYFRVWGSDTNEFERFTGGTLQLRTAPASARPDAVFWFRHAIPNATFDGTHGRIEFIVESKNADKTANANQVAVIDIEGIAKSGGTRTIVMDANPNLSWITLGKQSSTTPSTATGSGITDGNGAGISLISANGSDNISIVPKFIGNRSILQFRQEKKTPTTNYRRAHIDMDTLSSDEVASRLYVEDKRIPVMSCILCVNFNANPTWSQVDINEAETTTAPFILAYKKHTSRTRQYAIPESTLIVDGPSSVYLGANTNAFASNQRWFRFYMNQLTPFMNGTTASAFWTAHAEIQVWDCQAQRQHDNGIVTTYGTVANSRLAFFGQNPTANPPWTDVASGGFKSLRTNANSRIISHSIGQDMISGVRTGFLDLGLNIETQKPVMIRVAVYV